MNIASECNSCIFNNDTYKYLRSYMIQNEWDYTHEQARCIFVTFCLMNNIDADTPTCNKILATLYADAYLEDIMEFDSFVRFMNKYIR